MVGCRLAKMERAAVRFSLRLVDYVQGLPTFLHFSCWTSLLRNLTIFLWRGLIFRQRGGAVKMARRLIMAENRMKMHAKETPWGKYLRLNELARHRKRCRDMRPTVDATPPQRSPHQIMNRERSDLEQVLGGASNWIGTYKPGVKNLSDCRPWSVPKVMKNDPAPFSTLKLQPRDDKLRVHEKSIMDHRQRISKITKGPSVYSPKKKTYLSRGEAPWNHKAAEVNTVDEKLKEIRKWAMRHRTNTAPAAPTGIIASLAAIFFAPEPEPVVESISPVTDEDAARSPELARLKEVQEAGDPTF